MLQGAEDKLLEETPIVPIFQKGGASLRRDTIKTGLLTNLEESIHLKKLNFLINNIIDNLKDDECRSFNIHRLVFYLLINYLLSNKSVSLTCFNTSQVSNAFDDKLAYLSANR